MQARVRLFLPKPAFIHVYESEVIMKIPYGYVLANREIIVHEERADVVRSIFGYYLAGASLGKIVDMLYAKGIPSPSGNPKWGRAAVDKLLSNAKYIPIVGVETYWNAMRMYRSLISSVVMTPVLPFFFQYSRKSEIWVVLIYLRRRGLISGCFPGMSSFVVIYVASVLPFKLSIHV